MPIHFNNKLPAKPAEKISTANVLNPVAGQVDSAGQKPSDHVGEPATNSVVGTVTKLALLQSSGPINENSKSGLNADPVDADAVHFADFFRAGGVFLFGGGEDFRGVVDFEIDFTRVKIALQRRDQLAGLL